MLKPHHLRMPRLMLNDNGDAGGGNDNTDADQTGATADQQNAGDQQNNADQQQAGGDQQSDADHVAGQEALGDPGKRALDTMKARLKAERDARTKAEADLAAAKAAAEGREAEHAAAVEAQRVRDEALRNANQRIVRSEIKAIAAKHLADPLDALRFLDLEDFDVDENGDVDTASIEASITQLVHNKPYLAAQGGNRFQGSGDGGARNESQLAQITQQELDRMTPEQVAKAQDEGRLNKLLGITT